MQNTFKAMLLTQEEKRTRHEIVELTRDALPEGDVLVAVEYSSLNYKDAMAVTGTGKIVRQFPMVPGIDSAGTVLESASPAYKPGDKVILTGWSVGERYWGGYSQQQRVKAEWLVPMAEGLDSLRAMTIGTAGLTAMLCVMALQEAGVTSGKVLVTGASGGVGSVAVTLLAKLGYHVIALSQDPENTRDYLTGLGAAEVLGGPEWSEKPAALGGQRWAGVVDVVGGNVLARAIAETEYGGAVAACGLAGGVGLETTVMPFILRGVRLLGVDSVMCPVPRRVAAWARLAKELPESAHNQIQRVVSLNEVQALAAEMMAGKSRGRVVVDVNR
ncbi:MAG: MDR family oxidoreductase [Polaromonas sp.]